MNCTCQGCVSLKISGQYGKSQSLRYLSGWILLVLGECCRGLWGVSRETEQGLVPGVEVERLPALLAWLCLRSTKEPAYN